MLRKIVDELYPTAVDRLIAVAWLTLASLAAAILDVIY